MATVTNTEHFILTSRISVLHGMKDELTEDHMVAWNRNQLDHDGFRAKDIAGRVLTTMKAPREAFVSIVQDGDSVEPKLTLLTARGCRIVTVPLEMLAADDKTLS